MRTTHALLLSSALATAAGPVHADKAATDRALAQKYFERASRAEADERWDDALVDLEKALAFAETPGIRFHAARCEEQLGRYLAAERDYQRTLDVLAQAPKSERTSLQGLADDALKALRPRIPTIALHLPPDASAIEVRVDGVVVEDPSQPVRHDLGEAKIDASAPGREPFSTSVTLLPSSHVDVDVTLPPALAPSASVLPSPPALPPSSLPVTLPSAPARTRSSSLPWIGGGIAIAGAVTAGYFLFAKKSLESDTASVCARPLTICAQDERDAVASRYGTIALVGAGVAIAGAGLAIASYATGSALETAVELTPRGARLRGTF